MKSKNCSICGAEALPTYLDVKGHGMLYGMECDNGHSIAPEFGTKNRAVQAWNQAQEFVEKYTEEVG